MQITLSSVIHARNSRFEHKREINQIIEIIKRYPHGISRKKALELVGSKESTLRRAWSELCHNGVIKKVGYGVFVLSENNLKNFTLSSLGMTQMPEINLHAFQMSFPIIQDNSKPEDWDNINQKNNWKGFVKRIEGITLQKNTKHVQAWLWAREIKDLKDIEKLAFSAKFKIATLLWKLGVLIDIDNVTTTTKHIAMKRTELEKMIPKGMKVEIELGRVAEKIFENDRNESAKAWLDSSPFIGVETNDIAYARDVLLMPEYIKATNAAMAQLSQQNAWLAENIKAHREVLQSINEGQAVQAITLKALAEAVKELRDAVKELK